MRLHNSNHPKGPGLSELTFNQGGLLPCHVMVSHARPCHAAASSAMLDLDQPSGPTVLFFCHQIVAGPGARGLDPRALLPVRPGGGF